VTDPAVLARHAARALSEHAGWCRRNGLEFPPELALLLDTLTASNRQQPPNDALSTPDADPDCVDLSTAAARLGVSRRTVERLCASGELHSVRVRRRRLIPVTALDALPGSAR
jgi:excisionase family DNA binding protein